MPLRPEPDASVRREILFDDFEWPPREEVGIGVLTDSREITGRAPTPTEPRFSAAADESDNVPEQDSPAQQHRGPRIVWVGDGQPGHVSLDAFQSEVRSDAAQVAAIPGGGQQRTFAPRESVPDYVPNGSAVRPAITLATLAIAILCLTLAAVVYRRNAVGRSAVPFVPEREVATQAVITPAPATRPIAVTSVDRTRVPPRNEFDREAAPPDAPAIHKESTIQKERPVSSENATMVVPAPRAPETDVSRPVVELPRAPKPTTVVDTIAASGREPSTLATVDRPDVSLPRTTPAAPRALAETSAPAAPSLDGSPLTSAASNTDAARVTDAARGAVTVADEQRITALLKRFSDAYTQLNPAAAKAVWPGVDTRALARAFAALESQSIEFHGCALHLSDSEARASCPGELTYVPKIGRRSARTVSQQWNFVLKKNSTDWTIADAQMR